MNRLFDLQVNGYGGVDFSAADLTENRFAAACDAVFAAGTTAFLPTMITSSPERYERNLSIMRPVMEDARYARRLPGFHLEGPFLSPQEGAIGAHNPAWVREPDPAFLDTLQARAGGRIRLLTVAAGVPGIEDLIRHAASLGIVVSLGHQLPEPGAVGRAADAGARALTHLGNGIPATLPRHPNPIWEGLADDRLWMMVIPDGHHLPRTTLKAMIRAKGVARSIAVSDASPIAGLPPGRYETLGNPTVIDESGRLYNPESGYLVGSASTLADCRHVLEEEDWLDEEDRRRLTLDNPAALLGLEPNALGG